MIFKNFSTVLISNDGSFGINTNILETNLINQLILGTGLFFLLRDFLGDSLNQRQSEIITNVENSEKRLNEATLRLAEAKKQLAQAKLIIEDIKKESRLTQLNLLNDDYSQTKTELMRKFSSALASLQTRERLILAEIKQQISLLAIEQVVAKLKTQTQESLDQTKFTNAQIEMIQTTAKLLS